MTHNKENPAFPSTGWDETGKYPGHFLGLTLRQYASITLKVPDSGTEWLDDMIRQSLQDEFAGKALQGVLAHHASDEHDDKELVNQARVLADAMIKEKERK